MPEFGSYAIYIWLAYAITFFLILFLFLKSYFTEKKIESQTKK